jgi:hypothetical protein
MAEPWKNASVLISEWWRMTPEQLAQETLGNSSATTALNRGVEHDPMLVHRPLQLMLPARIANDIRVQMPFVFGNRVAPVDSMAWPIFGTC